MRPVGSRIVSFSCASPALAWRSQYETQVFAVAPDDESKIVGRLGSYEGVVRHDRTTVDRSDLIADVEAGAIGGRAEAHGRDDGIAVILVGVRSIRHPHVAARRAALPRETKAAAP